MTVVCSMTRSYWHPERGEARRWERRGWAGSQQEWGGGGEWHFPSERVCVGADKPAVVWLGQKLCDRDKSCSCLLSWDFIVAPANTANTEKADTHQGTRTRISGIKLSDVNGCIYLIQAHKQVRAGWNCVKSNCFTGLSTEYNKDELQGKKRTN